MEIKAWLFFVLNSKKIKNMRNEIFGELKVKSHKEISWSCKKENASCLMTLYKHTSLSPMQKWVSVDWPGLLSEQALGHVYIV